MFKAEVIKIMSISVNPSFTIYKWSLRGSKLYRHVFVMKQTPHVKPLTHERKRTATEEPSEQPTEKLLEEWVCMCGWGVCVCVCVCVGGGLNQFYAHELSPLILNFGAAPNYKNMFYPPKCSLTHV